MAKKYLKNAKDKIEEKKEFDEEVLQIDRVTRVVKGGRRLRFRATVAIGDRKGRVGVGIGKATEVVNAIKKAVAQAKGSLVDVPITSGETIPHSLKMKYKSARLLLMPASPGTGVIAGGALRKILNLAGVKNVLSKDLGSRNTLVTAQASMKALRALRPLKPHMIASKTGHLAPLGMETPSEQHKKKEAAEKKSETSEVVAEKKEAAVEEKE
ncbi:30S ribosomal protein S5 [Candidatus Peregrinibacteria bacterium CG_4_10_14_0_2_um_filter_43_11]|nr:MAG: 30S ribosomal protein S5 [Candidatus Peregrinibacteria bacterium CG_4_10_14_0_2_um_filter_43_11]